MRSLRDPNGSPLLPSLPFAQPTENCRGEFGFHFKRQVSWLGCLGIVALSIVLVTAPVVCAQDPEANSLTPQQVEFFESKVRPLLVEHCYECHSGAEEQGGLRLDNRQGLRQGGDTGPAINEERLGESLILRAVRYEDFDLQMPPSGKLPAESIRVFEEWVKSGAGDPRVLDPNATQASGMSVEQGREFWSMRPVTKLKVPIDSIDSLEDWGGNPIDAFIAQRLKVSGLSPAMPASRRELLKRLSFDLIGLPPTLDELEAFEQDNAPGAVERQIDRLLDSPQYGVRYGRHWLDVARYSDSNGLDENIAYGNAWRYRDYVVDSMNADKPFNRFIEEQIAGDLLPDANRESITGTGYLVLGAKVLAEPDREKLTMDTIDEQLDALGKTFLGMTFGCVRCHDHKFDPVKQRDYYAMAAILRGTKTFGDSNFGAIKHWNERSFATDEEKQRLKEIDAQVAAANGAWNKLKSEGMQRLRDQVRSDAAEYLAITATLSADATLNQWAQAAVQSSTGKGEGAKGLHPRVLANARRYLDSHSESELFQVWREKGAAGDIEGIRSFYQNLFAKVHSEWEKAKAIDAGVKNLADPMLESARVALGDPSGFLAIPAKMEHALDDETLAKIHREAESARLFESSAPDETAVMAVADKGVVDGIPIHIRGSYRNLGAKVDRGFPEVMNPPGNDPIFSATSSGRLEFARWIASSSHPLTARVIVNRVWRWHFGVGLVSTTENFGVLGAPPSHPELLDYLARWFVESGWSLKALHRLILSSSTYQMASQHSDAQRAMSIDPENRLLWRFEMQRLSAEQLRDSILFTSDMLDLRLGGKSVPLRNRQFVFDHTSIDHTKYESHRRTVYLPIIRNHLFTLFEQFDFPDPTMPIGDRQTTTVSPQMLLLMNAPWVLESASHLAQSSSAIASDPTQRAQWLINKIFGRRATQTELQRIIEYVGIGATDEQIRWELVSQNLLISSESIYVP